MITLSVGDAFSTFNRKFIATVHSVNNFVDQPNETTSFYVMNLTSTTSHCDDFLVSYSPSGIALFDEDFPDMVEHIEFTSSELNVDISAFL
jgi:hypothetical protein